MKQTRMYQRGMLSLNSFQCILVFRIAVHVSFAVATYFPKVDVISLQKAYFPSKKADGDNQVLVLFY